MKDRTYGFWNSRYNMIDTASTLVLLMGMMYAEQYNGIVKRYSVKYDEWYEYGTYEYAESGGSFVGTAYDSKYDM